MISINKRIAFLALLATPQFAAAHSPIKGIENFYSGLLHPVFVPAHLLLLIALGLLVGQKGVNENQASFLAFLITTAIGLIAAWFSIGGEKEMYLLSGAAIIGLLVASNLPMRTHWCAIIAALAGLLIGMDSTQEALTGRKKFVTLLGTGIGIYLVFLYAMGLADYFNKKPWQKVGVRVMGSWIAASSILVLAFSFASSSGT
jgi:hydrogenase/urease accessory protein HupE